jgi:hypothetical protein
MKPRAMKNGKAKKMMRGGMAEKPMAMKRGGAAKKMMRGGMAKAPMAMKTGGAAKKK